MNDEYGCVYVDTPISSVRRFCFLFSIFFELWWEWRTWPSMLDIGDEERERNFEKLNQIPASCDGILLSLTITCKSLYQKPCAKLRPWAAK